MELFYGAFSGLCQNIVGFPLDTIKVLKQNNMGFKYNNPLRYYRGFSYSTTSQIVTTSLNFFLLHKIDDYIKNKYISGFFTGVLITPCVFVFEVGKIKNQVSNKRIKIDFQDVLSTKGKGTTLVRESIALSIYFGVYYQLKNKLSDFHAGGIAGMCNWFFTYPLDIIKTRQMTYYLDFKKAYKMGNLTQGFAVCLLRAYIVNAVGFQSYEYAKILLN